MEILEPDVESYLEGFYVWSGMHNNMCSLGEISENLNILNEKTWLPHFIRQ